MPSSISQDDPFVKGIAAEVTRLLRKNPPIPREWFTVAELAVYINKPENSIREMIRAGEIPACKLGGQYRINKVEFDASLRG